jgi:MSHA biogenesis protein MshL
MGKNVSLISSILIAVWLSGCYTATPPTNPKKLSETARTASASSQIKEYEERSNATPPPPMVLPSVYQNISPLSGKTISFGAERANLSQLLYLIAKNAGLNLIVDNDVDANKTLTLTFEKASIEDALETIMDLSGCTYTLKNNMLYVKQYTQRTFSIPYIHTKALLIRHWGGIFWAIPNGTGLSGKFALSYKNPIEANDFYKQIETNVKELLSPNGKFSLNKFYRNPHRHRYQDGFG